MALIIPDCTPAPKAAITAERLEELFPSVEPGIVPPGVKVLYQLKRVQEKTRGGIIRPDQVRDADRETATYAKCVSLGSHAFRDRKDGTPWHGGPWVKPGDYVLINSWGAKRISIGGVDYAIAYDEDLVAIVTDLSLLDG